MSGERDWNAEVIAEFRANQGQVAAPYDDPPPMLLLHTVGARSGREHVVPMRCLPDGDRLYVFASAHGSARNPDWYHNVVAHPDFDIEMGAERGAERGIESDPRARHRGARRGAGGHLQPPRGPLPHLRRVPARAAAHHPGDPPRPARPYPLKQYQ